LFEGWWVGMNLGVEYIRFNPVQSFRKGFFFKSMYREKAGLFSIGQKHPLERSWTPRPPIFYSTTYLKSPYTGVPISISPLWSSDKSFWAVLENFVRDFSKAQSIVYFLTKMMHIILNKLTMVKKKLHFFFASIFVLIWN